MATTRSRAKGESGRGRAKAPSSEPVSSWGKTPAADAGVLRSVLDGMAEAVVVADAAGRLVYFNPAAERIHGLGLTSEPPEGWGRRYGIFLPDGASPCPAERIPLARALRGERSDHVELYVRRPDGTGNPVEVTGRPIVRALDGAVLGGVVVYSDITRRKSAEQLLRATEVRLRRTLDGLLEGCMIIGFDWTYLYINDAAAAHGHQKRENIIGRTMMELYPGVERSAVFAAYRRCMVDRKPQRFESEYTFADGSVGWYAFSVEPVPEGIFVLSLDVTERKRAEEQLKASSSYARGLIEASLDPLVTISAEGKITDVNAASEAVTGVPRAELIGSDFSDYFTEPERARAGYQAVFAQGQVRDYPLTIRHRSGKTTDVLYNATVYRDAGGEAEGVFAAARDITERLRSEREIRRLSRLYDVLSRVNAMLIRVRRPQELFEGACRIAVENGSFEMAWVGVIDEKTRAIRPVASHGNVGSYLDAIRISGDDVPEGRGPTGAALREGRGFVCRDIEHDPLMLPWRDAALAMGYRASAAFPLRTGDVVTGVFTVYSRDAGLFAPEEVRLLEQLASDISYALVILERERQRRRAEEQLRQAQKMEAVGRLAGGIAHDFNNLLTIVLANLGLMETAPSHPRVQEIRDIEAAVQRGRTMVRQLLDFARQGAVELVPCDLGALAADVAHMLRRVLPENIELECDATPGVGVATVDAGAMEQVLMNLATNARDAMPNGGRLHIGVDVVRVGAEEAGQVGAEPGAYVRTTVRDNGVGMDEETLRHLFDPFFTTKPLGKGTGLGLPMVYGLVRQHGGFVRVVSERGRGTAVEVLVPAGAGPVTKREAATAPPAATLPRGTETILVVEDQGELRRAAIRILERYGYRTIEAANGEEALLKLASGADVALVFTDLVMPKLGGKALYDEVCAARGPMPFLFASGYTSQDTAERMGLDPRLPFLPKPWTLADLVRRVREVLDAPPHADPQ